MRVVLDGSFPLANVYFYRFCGISMTGGVGEVSACFTLVPLANCLVICCCEARSMNLKFH